MVIVLLVFYDIIGWGNVIGGKCIFIEDVVE